MDNAITGRQIAAARALIGMSQAELAQKAKLSVPTLKRMEASSGEVVGLANNVAAVRSAIEGAGVEFTNDGQPGVRLNAVWMLHRVADRASAQMEKLLGMLGRGNSWKIVQTSTGLECQNQDHEVIGIVRAGQAESPALKFTPEIGKLLYADRTNPSELCIWVTEMVKGVQLGKAKGKRK